MKCLSCGSPDHTVSSTQCPAWKKEKEICAVKATQNISYPQARREVEEKTPNPLNKTYAQVTKTQVETVTAQTQTDPLPQLPPLKLLPPTPSHQSPVGDESAASTQTPAESVASAPAHSCPTPRPNADTPCPGATARPGAWQVVGGRARVKPTGSGQPTPSLPRPLSPSRGRPERQSRPAIKVAGGRCRSSHSVGRFPSGGGNSSFA